MKTTKTTTKTKAEAKLAKKTNKKVVKPAYKVELVDIDTFDDAAYAFANAKFEANLPMNRADVEAFAHDAKMEAMCIVAALIVDSLTLLSTINWCDCIKPTKKPNVFKRFWKWLSTSKKR